MRLILDWMEVWAPLIPTAVWLRYLHIYKRIIPVNIYFVLAFIIGLLAVLEWKGYFLFRPDELGGNNFFYNLHSLLRALLFCWFITRFITEGSRRLVGVLFIIYLSALIYIYGFITSMYYFNSQAQACEAVLLLISGLLFLFKLLTDDVPIRFSRSPEFWIVIGLLLFEACNFTIFLFYTLIPSDEYDFATLLWDVTNFLYLIFALLTTRGFLIARQ
ncbi:MAG TPA: hypothetical protein PKD90_02090 [Phnomibacter sp.]|nr:hypothetical protein [Phnomibacter sp.]